MDIFCMKCKQKREANDLKEVAMKNGSNGVSGVCSVCGTKVFTIKKKVTA